MGILNENYVIKILVVAPTKDMCAGIDWDAEPRLGVRPDAELARELGVSTNSVFCARRNRGIPPPPRRIREVP